MANRLINLLMQIHSRLPLWVSGGYMQIVYFVRHLQTLFLHSYILKGEERVSGTPFKIAYFGRDPRILSYWKRILFREGMQATRVSRIPVWKAYSVAHRMTGNIDLAIVEVSRLTRRFARSGKGFILPRWFYTQIDVKASLRAIKHHDTLKQIRKYGFSMEERFHRDDLMLFYERMIKPYILDRHSDAAVITDISYYRKRFGRKGSRLFFLMKENEPVAGAFNERTHGMVKFSGIGILDGDREFFKMGAIRALDYFMLRDYEENHVELIDFGGTSPLLSDGLTFFKKSMRAIPNEKMLFGEKSLWIFPVSDSAGLHAVLRHNPFIFISQKQFFRALFLDSSALEDKNELLKILKKTRFENLAGTKIFCWNGTEKISQWVNEESLAGHEVIAFAIPPR